MGEFTLELNDDQKAVRDWIHGFAADVMRPAAADLFGGSGGSPYSLEMTQSTLPFPTASALTSSPGRSPMIVARPGPVIL